MNVTALTPGHATGIAVEDSGRLWEVYETYLWYHRVAGHTEDTVKFYAKEVRLFLRDIDPSCEFLDELLPRHILAHLGSMKERGLKPRTVCSRWQAITTWLNWCVEGDLIKTSPAKNIKRPKVPKTRKPFISEKQFSALLELCPLNTFSGARRQAMLWMMATTGIRRNEMWMLEKKDLDWDASTIRIIYCKGQKERQVPFDRRCQLTMLRYLQQRSDTLDWLWVTEEGVRLGYDGIWKGLRRIADRAGVTLQDTCHIFRRTFAANAVRQNIPRPYVKAVAGWSTTQMLELYVEAMEAEEGAIEAFREFKPCGK